MRMRYMMALAVFAAVAARGEDGVFMASGALVGTFDVYTAEDATYAVSSTAELADLWPATYRAGETVTLTAPGGAETTLVSGAAAAGTASLALDAGGVWTLANSRQGTARIGVAWAVHGDGGSLASGAAASAYGVDAVQAGPDRKTKKREALPVAYSGDDWRRDAAKAATLTFVSPDGTEETRTRTGTGAVAFTFGTAGDWTVRLAMADGTVRVATISVTVPGLVISIR